ncbi:MAG: pyridoxal-phosphate dependent enzyme [Saprospiraceae bacterium]|nr:pyridoxal-phosphate dependent enzyme [Saprospiraceae bacterium]
MRNQINSEKDFCASYSPLIELDDLALKSNHLRLFIKRDDLIHPQVNGNKWRKLKYNLIEARNLGFTKIATLGGAFSNHIYATAAAGQTFGFQTLGLIRGERADSLSPTLHFAEKCGMQLEFISREQYRIKENLPQHVVNQGYYFLPEGGSNALAFEGCSEIVSEIREQLTSPPDYLCVACGTGGTVAGIIICKEENEK